MAGSVHTMRECTVVLDVCYRTGDFFKIAYNLKCHQSVIILYNGLANDKLSVDKLKKCKTLKHEWNDRMIMAPSSGHEGSLITDSCMSIGK